MNKFAILCSKVKVCTFIMEIDSSSKIMAAMHLLGTSSSRCFILSFVISTKYPFVLFYSYFFINLLYVYCGFFSSPESVHKNVEVVRIAVTRLPCTLK